MEPNWRIEYYQDNEEDCIFYAMQQYSDFNKPIIYFFNQRFDPVWKIINFENEEGRYWIYHENIFKPSQSSPITINNLEKLRVPQIKTKLAEEAINLYEGLKQKRDQQK